MPGNRPTQLIKRTKRKTAISKFVAPEKRHIPTLEKLLANLTKDEAIPQTYPPNHGKIKEIDNRKNR